MATKQITFNFENRKITAGEFGASFGHNVLIAERIKENLRITRTMSAEWTETGAVITYKGKLAKTTQEDIWYLSKKGIITNLSY